MSCGPSRLFSAMARPPYILRDCGEQALSIEFGEDVDPDIHNRVLALDVALSALALDGLRETAPSYRALMAHYDPLVLPREVLARRIAECAQAPAPPRGSADIWRIPCCYDPALAEDIAEAAALAGVSAATLAATHANAAYRVYMYGFAPGYCYLGGLPEALAISRRAAPRPPCPENSVLIGGGLGLIATFSMPTGWYVIGRTPERLFAPERDAPFFLQPGDGLCFAPVDKEEYAALARRVENGERVARKIAPNAAPE